MRLRADPRWRGLVTWTLVAGIALAILVAAVASLALPASAPLHPWFGVLHWLMLAVWLPCTVALAVRLQRVAVRPDASQAESAL